MNHWDDRRPDLKCVQSLPTEVRSHRPDADYVGRCISVTRMKGGKEGTGGISRIHNTTKSASLHDFHSALGRILCIGMTNVDLRSKLRLCVLLTAP